MIDALNSEFNASGEDAFLDGELKGWGENTILGGEFQDGFFAYYNESRDYEFGVRRDIVAFMAKHDWYFDCQDAGTFIGYYLGN